MTETSRYPLRRSSSPYRKISSSPKIQRRKSKISSEDQAIFDSINVATYNDTPEHMYGLDKNADDEAFIASKSIGLITEQKKKLLVGLKEKRARWYQLALSLVALAVIYEGCSRLLLKSTHPLPPNKIKEEKNNTDEKTFQRLLDQISIQKDFIDGFSNQIKTLEQKQIVANCSCDHKVESLLDDGRSQKTLIENLQKQMLATVDVVKSLSDQLSNLQEAVLNQDQASKGHPQTLCQGEDCYLSSTKTMAAVQAAIDLFRADVIGLPDFALETGGGSIHKSYHSDTCDVGAPIIKVFGLPLWQDPRSPRTVIRPDNAAGKCWPMKGDSGYIVIKLATDVEVTMVTLEHLDKRLDKYSNYMYKSAPKDFEVYGWLDKDGKTKVSLGSYEYKREENPTQTFKVKVKLPRPVRYVELRVLSNYGNKDCTCIYRFRVHGNSMEWKDNA